jgi:uncharacterized protein YebE (UPF0316 family)
VSDVLAYLDQHLWLWPVFIIIARVIDVSLGTIRTITVVRGHRLIAAVRGFFEVLIWVTAVSGVLTDITLLKLLSYAVGFALGNFCGILIESRIGLGTQMVTFISRHRTHSVAFALRLAGYPVTEIEAHGRQSQIALCFAILSRRRVPEAVAIAQHTDEDVRVVIQDVRTTTLGFPASPHPFTGWRAILKKK